MRDQHLTKRQEAHAVRIWGVCKEASWDITPIQIAAITGIQVTEVRKVIRLKNWQVTSGNVGNTNSKNSDDPVEVDLEIDD